MENNEKLTFGEETGQSGKSKMLVGGGLDGENDVFLALKRK